MHGNHRGDKIHQIIWVVDGLQGNYSGPQKRLDKKFLETWLGEEHRKGFWKFHCPMVRFHMFLGYAFCWIR